MANISSSIVPIKKGSAIVKSGKFFNGSAQQKRPKVSQKTTKVGKSNQNLLGSIEKKVVKIDKVLKSSLLFQKKESEKKRKQRIGKSFADKEKELEKKKPKQEKGPKLPEGPKLGLFDIIRNYIGNVIFGFFAVRLIDFLPRLLKLVPTIVSVGDFIIDMSGKLLNGLVTFIDWGYKAIDGTHRFIKNIGGEKLAQNFDKFVNVIDNVIEIAVIAAIATADSGGDGGNDLLDMGKDFIEDKVKKRFFQRGAQTAAQEAGGAAAESVGGGAAEAGGLGLGAVTGIIAGVGLLASALGEGAFQIKKVGQGFEKKIDEFSNAGKKDKNPITRALKMGVWGAFGPMLRLGNWLLNGIGVTLDIIGAPFRYAVELIRFGIMLVTGDTKGMAEQRKNLAKFDARIRDGIREHFAGFLSPLLRILGQKDLAAGLEKKGSWGSLFGQEGTKGMGYAGGGNTSTRGGKSVTSSAKRTVKKQAVRVVSVKPQKVKPGASVGGENNLKKLFPEESKTAKEKTVNPLGYMKSSSNRFSTPFGFGGLFSLLTKSQLGQEPTKVDYQNAAQGLMAWMQKTQILSAGGAFAEGGKVDSSIFNYDESMKNTIAKSIQDSVAPSIDDTINDLRKQLGLKEIQGDPSPGEGPDGSSPDDPAGIGGELSGDDKNKFMQVALAAIKAGDILNGYVTASQFALESGWGKYPSGKNNYFGQKGKPGTARRTREVYGGKDSYIVDTFKDYPSLEAGIAEHVKLWKSTYASAKTPAEAFRMLKAAGYATDPNYVNALSNVYRTATRKLANEVPTDKPVATASPGGFDQKYDLGKGYGNKGVKLAGDLGRYIYKVLKTPQQFQAVTEHPDFGGISGKHASPGYHGYHKYGRAVDIGAFAYEQGPILKAVADYNRSNNLKPVELFDAKHDPTGEHQNHVHVAYEKGGETLGYPHLARLGEKGKETVIDADSSVPEVRSMLLAVNQAKDSRGVMKAIQQYAPYDAMSPQSIIINSDQGDQSESSQPQLIPLGGGGGKGGHDHQFEDSLMHG